MTLPIEVQNFIEKYKQVSFKDDEKAFFLFCKEAVALAKKHKAVRSEIAYTIVSKGSVFGEFGKVGENTIITEIRSYAMDLEVPDHAVYVGDGISIAEKWRIIGYDVEQELSRFKSAK